MNTSHTEDQAIPAAATGTTPEAKPTTKAHGGPRKPQVAPTKAKPPHKTTAAKKGAKSPQKTGKAKAQDARQGSKTAQVLDLLRRPRGATLRELTKATGWQPHSVRGFLSGALSKKRGLTIRSNKGADGERRYSLKA